jgi:Rieske Fe-S protein
VSACALAGIGLGAALLADDAMAAGGIVRLPDGRVVVTVAKVPGLAKVGGVVNLGTVKGAPVAVVRTGASTYKAINLSCTHQGTTVNQTGSSWTCPSHGSQFALDGALRRGPAETSLGTVPAILKKGKLTVG